MHSFKSELEAANQALALVIAEHDALRSMYLEGTYEITLRSRTRTIVLPVQGVVVGELHTLLEQDAFRRYEKLKGDITYNQHEVELGSTRAKEAQESWLVRQKEA